MDRVRKIALQIMNLAGEKFTEDFNQNKATLAQYAAVTSKQLRNKIAGYITAAVTQKIKQEKAEAAEGKVEEPQAAEVAAG